MDDSPLITLHSVPPGCRHHQAVIEDYLIRKEPDLNDAAGDNDGAKYFAFRDPKIKIFKPQDCAYELMSEQEIDEFLKLEDEADIRRKIESKLDKEYPKGEPREIFISLMMNVRKYCKKSEFDLERTGAALSIFYLTHIYTTSKFDMSPDKVFAYFKELVFCNSLPFPPKRRKIFTHDETKSILEFFYKIYLRNLALLRLLCLPSFGFLVQYDFRCEEEQQVESNKIEEKIEKKREKMDKKPKKATKKSPSKSASSKKKK